MKVKIGDKIYDSNDVPIMIIFDEVDKENIASMLPNNIKYCFYPCEDTKGIGVYDTHV